MSEAGRRWLRIAAWAVVIAPALGQVALLLAAMFGRLPYPYDLEWMEGGMLNHAARIADGHGIYGPPSVDFIPYLYTPLYPGLIAALEPITGISYQVARAISVLSVLGLLVLAWRAIAAGAAGDRRSGAHWAGVALACGLIAATYPWVDGWYDIARADSLFLTMVVGGLLAVMRWARAGDGWRGHGRIAIAAGILGLSFFCKQTGVLYVAGGGALLLVLNWRRVPVYVATAGAVGLGGTWLLSRATGGWFWTYAYEVHQAHDFGMHRFKEAWWLMLGKYPAMTIAIAVGLIGVAASWAIARERPRGSGPLLAWSWVFAVSCLVGALGWGTQWAHYNAFVPALATGAIAAGCALPALAGAAAAIPRAPAALGPALAWVTSAAMALALVGAWWSPAAFVPRAEDRAAGDRLIETIAALEGEVFIPFHPWYARLAGKRAYTHRMGVMDVSFRHPKKQKSWPVLGLREALEEARFDYIIWDNRDVDHYFTGMKRRYRLDDDLPKDARPRVYTGNRVVPKQIWVPADPVDPPPGATALWTFEDGKLEGWTIEGTAWGRRPERSQLPGQAAVRRYLGRYYVTSMHGGDQATGTLFSPAFIVTGSRLTLRVGGGNDPEKLRAELQIDGAAVDFATGGNSERMDERGFDLRAYQGRTARIVLVDRSDGSWGHLNVDEIWLWK